MTGRFDGKSVFVTGASRGLGAAIARGFGREGAAIVVVGYHAQQALAQAVVDDIETNGGRAMALEIDVGDQASVDAAMNALQAEDITIDVLINNAAIVRDAFVPMAAMDDWLDVLNVNLTGTFRCCRAMVRPMLGRRSGVVVNIGSVAGQHASPGQASYAASKGGMIALTKTMAAELAPRGVRVNAVIPGLLSTGMGSRLDHRIVGERTRAIPVGRFGEADEVVDAVLFIASDAATYIVGHCLVVDGGLTL